MHLFRAILTAAACLTAALPAAAQAASITFEGDTLVYRAAPGERNYVFIGNGVGGRIRLNDSLIPATFPADRCADTGGPGYDCDVPAAIRLELGDAVDRNDFSDGYTGTTPVEVHGGAGDDGLQAHFDAPTPVVLDGGEGNDALRGYGSADVLRGGPGNDGLLGAGGTDELRGGEGNDTLEPDDNAEPSADIVDGGPGVDTLDDYVQYFPGGDGVFPPVDITFDGGAGDGRPGENDDVTGIERMTALVSGRFVLTDGVEEISIWSNMDGGASTVEGRGGNDTLTGHDQIETIDGGAGDDRIEGGFNHDALVGGPGKDLVYGDQTARCGSSETVCVPYGNDVIDVRDGEADVVDCGPGNDRVIVDALDVVANCETIDSAGTAVAPGGSQGAVGGAAGGGSGGAGGGTAGPATGIALKGTVKLPGALTKGVKLTLTGAKPGKRTVTAKHGGRVVASGSVKVSTGGSATVTLRFTAAARRALREKKSVKLAISGAGLSTTITLKR